MRKHTFVLPKQSTYAARIAVFLAAFLIAASSVIQLTNSAYADVYDDQIKALQSKIAGYQQQQASLQQQANTLQTKIAELQAQQAAIQAQIDVNQAKYDQLTANIDSTQKKITATEAILANTIADMYVQSRTTPLEMVASSSNIADYVNAQQYRDVASDQVNSAIKQIQSLKASLVKQQADVKTVLDDEQSQRTTLQASKDEQQSILDQTNGNEAAYQGMINDSNSQISALVAAQIAAQAAKQAAYGGTVAMGPGDPNMGGYPSNWAGASQDSIVDYWGMYNRECVSYAAYKVEATFGSLGKAAAGNPMFYWGGYGNANNWPSNARSMGIPVDSTPAVHTVAVYYDNVAGHAAWVEAVNGDQVTVSQFNYFSATLGHGKFSTMTVNKTFFDAYIHFGS